VRERIARAAERRGSDPSAICLVAVSKGVEAERIGQAITAGVTDLGENYLQEALPKLAVLGDRARWHFIGHLQTNKARAAVGRFALIQSLDSERLANELERRAGEAGVCAEVLVEVNTSGDPGKFGVAPEGLEPLLAHCGQLAHLRVRGLMTIGRLGAEAEGTRACFRTLAGLFSRCRDVPGVEMRWLSMGMSGDFEIAIEEGSNMVRVGTAIFGPRPSR